MFRFFSATAIAFAGLLNLQGCGDGESQVTVPKNPPHTPTALEQDLNKQKPAGGKVGGSNGARVDLKLNETAPAPVEQTDSHTNGARVDVKLNETNPTQVENPGRAFVLKIEDKGKQSRAALENKQRDGQVQAVSKPRSSSEKASKQSVSRDANLPNHDGRSSTTTTQSARVQSPRIVHQRQISGSTVRTESAKVE